MGKKARGGFSFGDDGNREDVVATVKDIARISKAMVGLRDNDLVKDRMSQDILAMMAECGRS
jgi:hypothetical protein